MSNERSPREVCSTTIGTREDWTRPISMEAPFAKLQLLGCITIAQPVGCTTEESMDHTVERELVVPEETEEVWRSLAEPEWLGDNASIDLREAGEVHAGERDGFVEEADAPRRLVFWWSAPGEDATRVEIDLDGTDDGTCVRVTESRPL